MNEIHENIKKFIPEDFEKDASPQEKKLWNFLKVYPETFNRSVLAGFGGFLFVCHAAGLVVEIEKFRRFGDERSGSLGKKRGSAPGVGSQTYCLYPQGAGYRF